MKVHSSDTRAHQESFEDLTTYSLILINRFRRLHSNFGMSVKTLPFEVMRVRMTAGKFLFQGEIVFLTPHLKKKQSHEKYNTRHLFIINIIHMGL